MSVMRTHRDGPRRPWNAEEETVTARFAARLEVLAGGDALRRERLTRSLRDDLAHIDGLDLKLAPTSPIVVGDQELWRHRGGVGAELAAASETAPDEHGPDEALRTRLYRHLHHDDPAVQLGVIVNGHLADAQLSDGSAVLLDPGTASGRDPAVHLEQMLRRRRLLAGPDARAARRIPAWTLDADGV